MGRGTLFRSEALHTLQSPEQLGATLRAVHPASALALLALAGLFSVALVGACIVTVPIQVKAEAILMSSKGMLELTIAAQNEGRVVEVLVSDRDRVAPGDVIARIERPELRLELTQAESERDQLAESMDDINRLQGEMLRASKDVRDQIRQQAEISSRFLEERLAALQQLTRAVEDLRTKGIVNVERILTIRSDLADTQERLAS